MPDQRTPGRLEQLTASIRALGVDSHNTYYDSNDRLNHCVLVWGDESDRPAIVVHMTSKESTIALMALAGQEMERRLREERPEFDVPDIIW